MDAMPIKGTEAQRLRQSVNKEKLDELTKKELQREHIDKLRKMRAKKIHEKMNDKVKRTKEELDQNITRQTRQKRLEQRRREEEYEERLTDISRKLETRPLLINQVDEEIARRIADKKYRELLRKAGLNEDVLNDDHRDSGVKVAKPVPKHQAPDEWIYQ